jgi:hypothetical protein
MMEERYLTRIEAAEYLTRRGLKISPNTLQKFVTVGGGPTYRIWGHRALYTPADLDAYAEGKLSAPRISTSNHAAA